MKDKIPEKYPDVTLENFFKYFNDNLKYLESDDEGTCEQFIGESGARIARLFADGSVEDIENYDKSELDVLGKLSAKVTVYIERFQRLAEEFIGKKELIELLYVTCRQFGIFCRDVQKLDIHFRYYDKNKLVRQLTLFIDLFLINAAKSDAVDSTELETIRELLTGWSKSSIMDTMSPLNPRDGGSTGGGGVNIWGSDFQEVDQSNSQITWVDIEKLKVIEA